MRVLLKAGLFLIFLVLILFLGQLIFQSIYSFPKNITYGVSFSPSYAKSLSLDWQKVFTEIISDLNVKNLRLVSDWEEIEPKKDQYDFSALDFMMAQVAEKKTNVILVVGNRQPRWPECHAPLWVKQLSVKERQDETLHFIKTVVERYNQKPEISAWQVENEPLLGVFGACDQPDEKFLASEVSLVRSLSQKKIIVTDSGELGFWIVPMRLGDMFGTTLYRKVYNPILGYTNYPILPYLYNLKSKLAGGKETIIAELQAEPWSPDNSLSVTPVDKQVQTFSLNDFKDYINYAKATGFNTDYLWGVEWWYFMAKMGHPEYLEYAKSLF